MGIYALKVLPLPMKDEDCIAYVMKAIEIEGVLRGIMQIKYYGIDYICDMAILLGAINGTSNVRPPSRGYKYMREYEKYYRGQLNNVKNLKDYMIQFDNKDVWIDKIRTAILG